MRSLLLTLSSPESTHQAGMALGAALLDSTVPANPIILLNGQMGSGKTTLIKSICQALGINPRVVTSPTYTLVNVYPGRLSVYHVDLFRLEQPEALLEMDQDDWVNPEGLTCIEWPDAARPLLRGEPVLELNLEPMAQNPSGRTMEVIALDDSWPQVLQALRTLEKP